MHRRGRPPARRPWLPLLGVALAVVAVCAIGLGRPAVAPPAPVAAESVAVEPAPLALPTGARVLIFGDSWVYGSAAVVPTRGFAYVAGEALGWETTVAGVRGSGYLKPGLDGPAYGERLAALDPSLSPDLVVLQGSINDRRLYPDGYRQAVTDAWDSIAGIYPRARFVVLGPAPHRLPLEKAVRRIDADLAELAAARGWWYISPVADAWITAANYHDVIDTGEIARHHPSTAGHAYLAERFVAAIAGLSGTGDVAADGMRDGATTR